MKLSKFEKKIPKKVFSVLKKRGFEELRPCQTKSINKGLFEDKSLLVCTPTASGKTLVAELAILNAIFHDLGKVIYVVPLRALASEKYKDFKRLYDKFFKIAISSGDIDRADSYLANYDLIITTSEKLDSLIRHKANWLNSVKVVVLDEIHLLNDPSRGPTLEILITMLRKLLPKLQIIGLSATIGNPEALAEWLDAELVLDYWRPVRLDKGVFLNNKIEFR
ncbi:DEAD/DEAH box helicase [Candidatus Woesearchaeota archaeon]|nr:DEAD/DEAH box helicase [Candidatus Woesearchaeota archaeon]